MFAFLQKTDKKIDAIKQRLEGKKHRLYTDIIGAFLFIIFAITVFILMPSQIQVKQRSVTSGRTFPSILMILIIGCSLILFIRNIIALIQKRSIPFVEIELLVEVRALVIFIIFIAYYFMMKYIGFIPGSVVFSVLMLFYFRCKKWSFYLIAVGAAVLIGVLFQYVLRVRLP